MSYPSLSTLPGLLWSKQFYHYIIEAWLEGDPEGPDPPSERLKGRNASGDWAHLFNRDIISMPDKWEYPWVCDHTHSLSHCSWTIPNRTSHVYHQQVIIVMPFSCFSCVPKAFLLLGYHILHCTCRLRSLPLATPFPSLPLLGPPSSPTPPSPSFPASPPPLPPPCSMPPGI